MPQLTAKSQRERKVKCRTCYIDMGRQLRLDGGEDWLCAKCGRCWVIPVHEEVVPAKVKKPRKKRDKAR